MMLDSLKKLFGPKSTNHEANKKHSVNELHLASSVILIEAARMDDNIDNHEYASIIDLIRSRFDLSEEEVISVVELAEQVAENAVEISKFTSLIRDQFDHEERIEMIEMLWHVVYADGKVHDHESNLLRRVSGLLYVSDRESGEARKRVVSNSQPSM